MSTGIVELTRLEENDIYGTFGVLKLNKEVVCVTLEPNDEENASFISSIPAQQYMCTRFYSNKYERYTWKVMKVPRRSGILFHPGNTVKDTSGCILLAEHFGKLNDKRGVLNSGKTFRKFMDETNIYDILNLTIREVY